MSFTNKAHPAWRRVLCCAALVLHPGIDAQDSDAQPANLPSPQAFASIANLLTSLDDTAQECLESEPNGSLGNLSCQQLIAAIDGEEIARYLSECKTLTAWRDDFVVAFQTRETGADEQALHIMVQTEFYCGEDALRKRTTYVFPAFAAVTQAAATRTAPTPSSQSRVPSVDETFRTLERLMEETNQQWLDLRIENLRREAPQKYRF